MYSILIYIGDVKISYTKKNYIIIMQTFQLAVIALFENSDELSFSELQQATLLSEDQLTRHIQSLLDCKLLECADTVSNNHTHSDSSNVFTLHCFFVLGNSKREFNKAQQELYQQENKI